MAIAGIPPRRPAGRIDMVVICNWREQLQLAVRRDHRVQRDGQFPSASESVLSTAD
jgi:hypothetical protein